MNTDLRYPIGKFERPGDLTEAQRRPLIETIAETPAHLASAVANLSPAQLDAPYRPGGWTVRQVVHHVPDSHMNSYIRFKLALTEDAPTIKTYDEALWADLRDAAGTPVEVSLELLENLHKRWIVLLKSMTPEDWSRSFRHPDLGLVSLSQALALYAWHGRHHVAHVTALRARNNW